MSFPDHGVYRKVVDNVENYLNRQFQSKVMTISQENGQKPDFWKNCLQKFPKCVKMSFLDHSVNRKVVDDVDNYLDMKFQLKLMQCSQENSQKPSFLKNCL